ncbi:hypothetical protein CDAR_392931 [Caerostris darwini]|uniref:Uncharacterized protein n=1 Tax=Caerostris darwini TaxID=1538125 RepID=A0AAV4T1I7_9ARAC|nr:hypothetical protein CDAR_392931 [Caerostris darwini]
MFNVFAGVRRMDPGRGSVQSDRIRSNRDTGKHHLYTDHHELRPLPGHLLSLKKHRGCKAGQAHDSGILATGVRLCHPSDLHLRAGRCNFMLIVSGRAWNISKNK